MRAIDVDGETVVFAIRPSGQGQAVDRLPRGLPPAGYYLAGRSRTLSATLWSPPSRRQLADYADDELRALWRAKLTEQRKA